MRKAILQLVFFAIVFLFVFSCKNDDPVLPSIVGNWNEISYVASGCTDPLNNESRTCPGSTICDPLTISETTILSSAGNRKYTRTATTITMVDGSVSFILAYTLTDTTLETIQQYSASFGGCKEIRTYKRF